MTLVFYGTGAAFTYRNNQPGIIVKNDQKAGRQASLLMGATILASMIGLILGAALFLVSPPLAVRAATALLAGVVGIISFLRHSVYYQSDQARMGWRQDHVEFQLEVGYANLAIGIWGLVAAAGGWILVCGVILSLYATYLFCTLLLHKKEAHTWEELHIPEYRSRAVRSVISTGIFVVILAGFALLAFVQAGVVPIISP
ncbi:MAG: hypothetical protein GYA23_13340 [Methanomicrobiales archaeon]|nr:hypothetical protein [Methanomicrobiales archaeon]